MNRRNEQRIERAAQGVARAMGGWKFPALVIFVLVFLVVLLGVLLAIPSGEEGVGAFARDVRTWCFNYDPATGEMNWFYVTVMLTKPLGLAGLVAAIWHQELRQALKSIGGEMALIAGIAAVGVGLLGVSFAYVGQPQPAIDGDYPFPAERIRTEMDPPDFELEDHTGEKVTLDELEGKVVVVTAVYATCWDSCPLILQELRKVTDAIDADADDLVVVGITLDPEQDDADKLTSLADRHGVEHPQYRLLHGKSDEVNQVLDDFSVARQLDEERGEIDHANLFILIDRDGSIAYRLTLGDRTEQWLPRGIEVLLDE